MGDSYATASDDGTVRLWSTTTREMLACTRLVDKPNPLPNHTLNSGCVRSVAFSPDGRIVAAGTYDRVRV